ncbi:hypothetical protein SAMN04488065_0325 [Haloplanus vescus]|uniref:Amphi-Trp domain-containing protein n=1 Tax=Haloplanus vescus TaxID=555874 RepID=A0A1H3VVU6_9EURY|nr:hypothetical protein [Haloplanus vescus]SDZ78927.1 hypothetical protein SAMN04488065_0325 [Haloplanus vescus]
MADDNPHPVPDDEETPTVDAARTVKQYFESPASVSEDRVRDVLQDITRGTITDVRPRDTEFVVDIETAEGDPTRQSFTVRPTTNADGDPELVWSYIGATD